MRDVISAVANRQGRAISGNEECHIRLRRTLCYIAETAAASSNAPPTRAAGLYGSVPLLHYVIGGTSRDSNDFHIVTNLLAFLHRLL